MIKVIIRGNWSDCVGTDYCEALGIYKTLDDAWFAAETFAWERWEPQDDEESDWEDEGPDFWLEEYNPEEHDMLRISCGTFEDDFAAMK